MRSDAKYTSGAERSKAWYQRNKEKARYQMWAASLIRKYGVTVEDYEHMFTEQNGLCKICNEPETSTDSRYNTTIRLAVDHCHETGRVRGLLCNRCNRALGFVNEDIDHLQSMIDYLKDDIDG